MSFPFEGLKLFSVETLFQGKLTIPLEKQTRILAQIASRIDLSIRWEWSFGQKVRKVGQLEMSLKKFQDLGGCGILLMC